MPRPIKRLRADLSALRAQKKAEAQRAADLLRDGPMFCKSDACAAFRFRDPAFAQRMQDCGIIAHFMGTNGLCTGPGDYWMLSGITPVSRRGIEELCEIAEALKTPQIVVGDFEFIRVDEKLLGRDLGGYTITRATGEEVAAALCEAVAGTMVLRRTK